MHARQTARRRAACVGTHNRRVDYRPTAAVQAIGTRVAISRHVTRIGLRSPETQRTDGRSRVATAAGPLRQRVATGRVAAPTVDSPGVGRPTLPPPKPTFIKGDEWLRVSAEPFIVCPPPHGSDVWPRAMDYLALTLE